MVTTPPSQIKEDDGCESPSINTFDRGHFPDLLSAFDSSDTDSDSQGEEDDAYFEKARMVARQLGDLPSLRTRVDFVTPIPSASQMPSEFKPSDEEIALFESKFGPGSYGSLDSL